MKQLIRRSYKSIVKRGKVNERTTLRQFVQKMQEELDEVKLAIKTKKGMDKVTEEVGDLMNVCTIFFEHHKIDTIDQYIKIIEKNEHRED